LTKVQLFLSTNKSVNDTFMYVGFSKRNLHLNRRIKNSIINMTTIIMVFTGVF